MNRLNGAIVAAMTSPVAKEKFGAIGMAPMPLAPEKLKAFMGSEVAKWQRLVKEANVTPE